MAIGMLTLEQLKKEVAAGTIDTVIAALVDMQGRLMGKRFHAQYFVDGAYEETHGCNYLLAVDVAMEPVPGYKASSWEKGYGDFVLKPDMSTLRRIPWLPATALVLCDILDHHTHQDIPHSPRAILKKQLKRLDALKMKAYMASELEFFLFDDSFEQAHEKGYRNLRTSANYIEDYHIFQTSKEEGVMRAIRNGLHGAGIPVENSKGEAAPGQEEINVKYAEALDMADRHVIIKNGCKEIAHVLRQAGRARHVGAHAALFGGPASAFGRTHLFPCALHELLPPLHRRHLRADARGLELRQSHGRLPPLRRRYQGYPRGVPHRRLRSQSLSCLRCAACGRSRRHREEDGAGARLLGRCL